MLVKVLVLFTLLGATLHADSDWFSSDVSNSEAKMLLRKTQKILKKSGVYKGLVDGKYGKQTKSAISQAQKRLGLPQDGLVSWNLVAHLVLKKKATASSPKSDSVYEDDESSNVEPVQSTSVTSVEDVEPSRLIDVEVTNKEFHPTDIDLNRYQPFISWDITYRGSGLSRSTRAIKGTLVFTDLFDEDKFRVNVTINDPMDRGASVSQEGIGIEYNEFLDHHTWLRTTELRDMKTYFEVDQILYSDGSKESF